MSVVGFNQTYTAISGYQTIVCKPGFVLLSCGVDDTQKMNQEMYRFSIPTSPNSCQCYDRYGVACVAWCASVVRSFQIRASNAQIWTTQAYCSAGTYVVGCSILPTQANSTPADPFRQYYPSPDGRGCICSDTVSGARCEATCASNVMNHEIRSVSSSNHVYVTCPPSKHVLGCGINPIQSSSYEVYRTSFVKNSTSCECYDYFGCTCYAICGQLY